MGDRGQEVPRIGQAVAADGSEVRQAQWRAVVLRNVAARLRVEQLDAEFQTARQHGDFQRFKFQHAQFGGDAQPSLFWHQQQLAIGVEEHTLHGAVGAVAVDADSGRFFRRRIGRHAHQPVDEVGGLGRNIQRVPAQAIGRHFTQRATGQLPIQFDERRVIGRWLNAVHPGAPRFAAGHGECSAGEQFGVETVWRLLRGILADGQCARQRLAAEFVAEAGLVGQRWRR